MLTSVSVENFRAFRAAKVDLAALNIFVGPNNSGKSSIISAVGLIAQNAQSSAQRYSLALNGPHAQLGTFYDVVHGHSARSSMTIAFEISDFQYLYTFRYRPKRREIELVRAAVSSRDFELVYGSARGGSAARLRDIKAEKVYNLGQTRARFSGFQAIIPLLRLNEDGSLPKSHQLARRFVSQASLRLNELFRGFDSVGAFRVAPERTYYFSGEAYASVGRSGDNYAQI